MAEITKIRSSRQLIIDQNLDANAKRIINVAQPVNDQDVATKLYADSIAAGLSVHASVMHATTPTDGNINLTTGGLLTLDGVQVSDGDRILVKNQSDGTQNGIYIASTGTWLRASDYDDLPSGIDEVRAGDFFFVEEGNTLADTGWILTTNEPLVLGQTELEYTQFSSAGVIQAGLGLFKDSNTIRIGEATGGNARTSGVAKDGITASTYDIAVATDGSTININGSEQIYVPNGGIGTTQLANDSVDKTKIAADVAGFGLVQDTDGSLKVNAGVGLTTDISGVDTIDVNVDGTTIGINGLDQLTSLETFQKIYNYEEANAVPHTIQLAGDQGADGFRITKSSDNTDILFIEDNSAGLYVGQSSFSVDALDAAIYAEGKGIFETDSDTDTLTLRGMTGVNKTITLGGATTPLAIYSPDTDGMSFKTDLYGLNIGTDGSVDLDAINSSLNMDDGYIELGAGAASVRIENGDMELRSNLLLVRADTALQFQDQFTDNAIPLSETGVTALTTTSQSIIGAINEVNNNVINSSANAGAGLTEASGSVFNVNVDNSTIEINGSDNLQVKDDGITAAKLNADVAGAGLSLASGSNALQVNTDGSTLEINGDSIRVKASGITSNEIATGAVGSDEIATGAVGSDELATTSVTAAKINSDVAGLGLVKNGGTGALDVNVGAGLTIATDVVRVNYIRERLEIQSGGDIYFSLTSSPITGTEQIFLNGMLQEPGDDYTISDKDIVFVGGEGAIKLTDKIVACYFVA
jgi:hypothetical protein